MGDYAAIPAEDERIGTQVVDSAVTVHKALGPGLLESAYEACLCRELSKRGISFVSQIALPVLYDGIRIESGFRLDLLVAGRVIVELKAAEQMLPLYQAQLLTYLKLTGLRLGLLINFNVPVLKHGIKRMVR
jgi:GxxExxY protein